MGKIPKKNRLAGENQANQESFAPTLILDDGCGDRQKDQSLLAQASIMDGSCGGSDLGCNET